mmetsp:Transcript_45672/g.105503  ORF Transcript_45672/g.105503 Transcript_45672/m.105503 type:complete len:291 (-) Transcript_45672:609-1481(-)
MGDQRHHVEVDANIELGSSHPPLARGQRKAPIPSQLWGVREYDASEFPAATKPLPGSIHSFWKVVITNLPTTGNVAQAVVHRDGQVPGISMHSQLRQFLLRSPHARLVPEEFTEPGQNLFVVAPVLEEAPDLDVLAPVEVTCKFARKRGRPVLAPGLFLLVGKVPGPAEGLAGCHALLKRAVTVCRGRGPRHEPVLEGAQHGVPRIEVLTPGNCRVLFGEANGDTGLWMGLVESLGQPKQPNELQDLVARAALRFQPKHEVGWAQFLRACVGNHCLPHRLFYYVPVRVRN